MLQSLRHCVLLFKAFFSNKNKTKILLEFDSINWLVCSYNKYHFSYNSIQFGGLISELKIIKTFKVFQKDKLKNEKKQTKIKTKEKS